MRPAVHAIWLCLASTTAWAGGAQPFTITAPNALLRGLPSTVSLSGQPSSGGAGLFVALPNPSAPVYCPVQLGGDCLDLRGPSFLVSGIGLAGPGPQAFTVQPPVSPYYPNVRLQGAAIDGSGGTWVSNVVDLPVIDTCAAPVAAWPPPNATGVSPDATPTITFPHAAASAYEFALYRGTTPVARQLSAQGNTAILSPTQPLLPQTTYTVYLRNVCGDVASLRFTTAAASQGAAMVGTTWSLNTAGGFVVDPPGLDAFVDLDPLFADLHQTVAYQATAWHAPSGTLTLRQGRLLPSTGAQDLCATTTTLSGALDNDVDLSITASNWAGMGQPATLEATVGASPFPWSQVTIDVAVPRSVLEAASPGSGLTACSLLGLCDPCPTGTGQCVLLTLGGISAQPTSVPLVAVSTPGTGCAP